MNQIDKQVKLIFLFCFSFWMLSYSYKLSLFVYSYVITYSYKLVDSQAVFIFLTLQTPWDWVVLLKCQNRNDIHLGSQWWEYTYVRLQISYILVSLVWVVLHFCKVEYVCGFIVCEDYLLFFIVLDKG